MHPWPMLRLASLGQLPAPKSPHKQAAARVWAVPSPLPCPFPMYPHPNPRRLKLSPASLSPCKEGAASLA